MGGGAFAQVRRRVLAYLAAGVLEEFRRQGWARHGRALALAAGRVVRLAHRQRRQRAVVAGSRLRPSAFRWRVNTAPLLRRRARRRTCCSRRSGGFWHRVGFLPAPRWHCDRAAELCVAGACTVSRCGSCCATAQQGKNVAAGPVLFLFQQLLLTNLFAWPIWFAGSSRCCARRRPAFSATPTCSDR